MLQETSTLYKLIILYLLNKSSVPLTNNTISNFILDNNFTDYFNVQQIIGELLEDKYINVEASRNKSLFRITEEGRTTLKLLKAELSPKLKEDIDKYLTANRTALKEDISIMANYSRHGINHFVSTLYLEEDGDKLIELNLWASDETEADKLCAGWEKNCEDIYSYVMSKLLKQ